LRCSLDQSSDATAEAASHSDDAGTCMANPPTATPCGNTTGTAITCSGLLRDVVIVERPILKQLVPAWPGLGSLTAGDIFCWPIAKRIRPGLIRLVVRDAGSLSGSLGGARPLLPARASAHALAPPPCCCCCCCSRRAAAGRVSSSSSPSWFFPWSSRGPRATAPLECIQHCVAPASLTASLHARGPIALA
jgi:hypothetical protein